MFLKRIKQALLIPAVLVFINPAVLAESGLVASLSGKAWRHVRESGIYTDLLAGQSIPYGTRIKTGQGTVVLILNQDGSAFRIGSDKETTYSPVKSNSVNGINLVRFLKSFAKSEDRISSTTVRNLEAVPAVISQNDRIDSRQLLEHLRYMSHLSEKRDWNRLNGNLAILKNSFTDSAVINSFLFQIPNRDVERPVWSFHAISNAGFSHTTRELLSLKPGMSFQIMVSSKQTGYFYLFLTDINRSEPSTTRLVHPNLNRMEHANGEYYTLPQKISEYTVLTIPGSDEAYSAAEKGVAGIFWGYSCMAPLSNQMLLDMENRVLISDHHTDSSVKTAIEKSKPRQCPHFLFRKINIQHN